MSYAGKRVYVRGMYEGHAVIDEVFPGEIFSVQVTLEQPDSDGHAIKRVSWAEVEIITEEEAI